MPYCISCRTPLTFRPSTQCLRLCTAAWLRAAAWLLLPLQRFCMFCSSKRNIRDNTLLVAHFGRRLLAQKKDLVNWLFKFILSRDVPNSWWTKVKTMKQLQWRHIDTLRVTAESTAMNVPSCSSPAASAWHVLSAHWGLTPGRSKMVKQLSFSCLPGRPSGIGRISPN